MVINNLLKSRQLLKIKFSQHPLSDASSITYNKRDQLFINRVIKLIQENLSDNNYSIELLSEEIGVSRSGLHKKLKGIAGVGPNEFIRLIRLKHAAQLLKEGNHNISEVGYLSGFSSPSYFTKCFIAIFVYDLLHFMRFMLKGSTVADTHKTYKFFRKASFIYNDNNQKNPFNQDKLGLFFIYICLSLVMQRKLILDTHLLNITVNRLCQQLIENHGSFADTAIIGMQPRGVFLAEMIHKKLRQSINGDIDLGYLDTTFFRDDFRRRDTPVKANATKIPFIIENRNVVLIDDVLYTGRSVRAAMDAMIAFGRPNKVELLVLVNRQYSRQLPIEPDYVGKDVNTMESQKVLVELEAQGFKDNKIWLINKEIK